MASSIEMLVEEILKEYGIAYEVEIPLENFSVDFVLPQFKIAIEVDGDYWHRPGHRTESTEKKEVLIRNAGYVLVRISQSELKNQPERRVLKRIFAALRA
jgi:very-short-patch-repair endonuclease